MTDVLLALSTRISPPKKFTVDGDEYDLLGVDHLSPADEAEAQALLSRHALLAYELDATVNVLKGKAIAERLNECRIKVICKLTTLPVEVAKALPIGQQARLLEALQEEMSVNDDDEGSPDEADDGASA